MGLILFILGAVTAIICFITLVVKKFDCLAIHIPMWIGIVIMWVGNSLLKG